MITTIPKFIRFITSLTLIEILIFTVFRFVFFALFSDDSFNESSYSFWMGLRFDIQLAVLLNLPIYLFGAIKWIDPLKTSFGNIVWKIYFLLYNLVILFIYLGDFAYFDFFKKRVDATVTRFFYDIGDATTMMIQGYPVFKALFGFIIFGILAVIFFSIMAKKIENSSIIDEAVGAKKVFIYIVFTIVFIFAGYGKFEFFPLRWSDAFYSSNNFQSYLASNPVTYFANTFKNRDVKYDEKLAKKYYNNVADFLEMVKKDPEKLSFARIVKSNLDEKYKFNKPNIVFLICESMAYPRTSISGNPLNPTPFVKKLADNGISYSRYFTPHAGTARSVFTALTGMTDVERIKTSSRNPLCVSQNIPFNSSKDYVKQYFIGGSLNWGNVRGVISNIHDVITHEQSSYKYPATDVWGVSDIDLLQEVNDNLKTQTKPFITVVQLAGNHSPYTIPEVNYGFKAKENISKEDLKKYSFDGSLEDFNAQYFMDYSIEHFFNLAKDEKYFDNTIFILVGDHGLPKNSIHMKPNNTDLHAIHTPLVIYAPKLIKPQSIDYPVSEVDVGATISAITSNKFINSSFGRNLLEKDFDKKPHYTYYMTHEVNPTINLIGEKHILRVRADGSDVRLYNYEDFDKKDKQNVASQFPELTKEMLGLTRGIYEGTRYTRFHNSTEKVDKKIEQLYK